jgi:hypothetical protein
MRRTQIQLDHQTYEALRQVAFQRRKSLSATVREVLREALDLQPKGRKRLRDYRFIGAAASGEVNQISAEHDKVLGAGRW